MLWINLESIEGALDKLVESDVIVKVEFKGFISYRNAAKWVGKGCGNVLRNAASTSSKLQQAVRNLTASNTQQFVEASAADIER